MAIQAQHTLDVLNHWIQGIVSVIRRASEPHASVAFLGPVGTHPLTRGVFANAGSPAEESDRPQPCLPLPPESQEQPDFLLTPHQEGQPAGGKPPASSLEGSSGPS